MKQFKVFQPQGRYGTMSWDMFPDKYEATELLDDDVDEIMDDMWRSTLKDRSCEPPANEAEEPRRNYHSRERLTLMETGSRYGLEPWMPDMMLSMTDRDNRGAILEPNTEDLRRRKWHNKPVLAKNFKNDDDFSIPSQGIHPNTYYPMIRRSQPWLQSLFRVFRTSRDNLHHGGTVPTFQSSLLDRIATPDPNQFAELYHQPPENRRNRTTILSNNFDMGYRQTTDHEFQIGQYGKLYKDTPHMVLRSMIDYINPDQYQYKMVDIDGVPRGIVKGMAILSQSGLKDTYHKPGDKPQPRLTTKGNEIALDMILTGFRPGPSNDIYQILGYADPSAEFYSPDKYYNSQNNFRKEHYYREDFQNDIHKKTDQSQIDPIHKHLPEETRTKINYTVNNLEEKFKSEINPIIIEFMQDQIRKHASHDFSENEIRDKTIFNMIQNYPNVPLFIKKREKMKIPDHQKNMISPDVGLQEYNAVATPNRNFYSGDIFQNHYYKENTQGFPTSQLHPYYNNRLPTQMHEIQYSTDGDIAYYEQPRDTFMVGGANGMGIKSEIRRSAVHENNFGQENSAVIRKRN